MEKRTRPYEIVVRFHANGSAAAHVGHVEDVIDDDGVTIVASRQLPPKPLSLAGPEFDVLIPALDQALLRENAALVEERDRLLAESCGAGQ